MFLHFQRCNYSHIFPAGFVQCSLTIAQLLTDNSFLQDSFVQCFFIFNVATTDESFLQDSFNVHRRCVYLLSILIWFRRWLCFHFCFYFDVIFAFFLLSCSPNMRVFNVAVLCAAACGVLRCAAVTVLLCAAVSRDHCAAMRCCAAVQTRIMIEPEYW